jgi:hypothetical protein
LVSDEFDGILNEGLPEGRIMNEWMEADGFGFVEGYCGHFIKYAHRTTYLICVLSNCSRARTHFIPDRGFQSPTLQEERQTF